MSCVPTPVQLAPDDVAKSAVGGAWASAQEGQPQTMADWFATFGRPMTKDFETFSSRTEYLQGLSRPQEEKTNKW